MIQCILWFERITFYLIPVSSYCSNFLKTSFFLIGKPPPPLKFWKNEQLIELPVFLYTSIGRMSI